MNLAIATFAILGCMGLLIYRALLPHQRVFSRILVINSFGTKTVLLIALLAYINGRPDFLDLSLVYAMMNFIGTIAVLRFTRYGVPISSSDESQETIEQGDAEWR